MNDLLCVWSCIISGVHMYVPHLTVCYVLCLSVFFACVICVLMSSFCFESVGEKGSWPHPCHCHRFSLFPNKYFVSSFSDRMIEKKQFHSRWAKHSLRERSFGRCHFMVGTPELEESYADEFNVMKLMKLFEFKMMSILLVFRVAEFPL